MLAIIHSLIRSLPKSAGFSLLSFLARSDPAKLIESRAANTSLCLTGRNFPKQLLPLVDIATDMKKLKHHYDDKFLANRGIDF